jgi:hypothetical protein
MNRYSIVYLEQHSVNFKMVRVSFGENPGNRTISAIFHVNHKLLMKNGFCLFFKNNN